MSSAFATWPSLRALGPARARPSPDTAPRSRVRIGMPHLNAGGLSESWLFRHAGDAHWQALAARFGQATPHFLSEGGARLYPTFLTVRAMYRAPLHAFEENDELETEVALPWIARGYSHGAITIAGGRRRVRLDTLTMLAARSPESGELGAAKPAAALSDPSATEMNESAPALLALAKAARRGERHDDPFSGAAFARSLAPVASIAYEPSPYSDFNGAGLLYFASYVSIADTAERAFARRFGWTGGDWALVTSPVRRDVFYYANIALGQALTTHLLAVEWPSPDRVKTHLRMVRHGDGRTMADLITEKTIVRQAR
jgi:probable biosynthetic protein (TIGR04098 family)